MFRVKSRPVKKTKVDVIVLDDDTTKWLVSSRIMMLTPSDVDPEAYPVDNDNVGIYAGIPFTDYGKCKLLLDED